MVIIYTHEADFVTHQSNVLNFQLAARHTNRANIYADEELDAYVYPIDIDISLESQMNGIAISFVLIAILC